MTPPLRKTADLTIYARAMVYRKGNDLLSITTMFKQSFYKTLVHWEERQWPPDVTSCRTHTSGGAQGTSCAGPATYGLRHIGGGLMETHMVHLIWTTALTQLLHLSISASFYLPSLSLLHSRSRCRNMHQVRASAGRPLINRSAGEQRMARPIESLLPVRDRPRFPILHYRHWRGSHYSRCQVEQLCMLKALGSGAWEGSLLLSGLVVWSLAPPAHLSMCHLVRHLMDGGNLLNLKSPLQAHVPF